MCHYDVIGYLKYSNDKTYDSDGYGNCVEIILNHIQTSLREGRKRGGRGRGGGGGGERLREGERKGEREENRKKILHMYALV